MVTIKRSPTDPERLVQELLTHYIIDSHRTLHYYENTYWLYQPTGAYAECPKAVLEAQLQVIAQRLVDADYAERVRAVEIARILAAREGNRRPPNAKPAVAVTERNIKDAMFKLRSLVRLELEHGMPAWLGPVAEDATAPHYINTQDCLIDITDRNISEASTRKHTPLWFDAVQLPYPGSFEPLVQEVEEIDDDTVFVHYYHDETGQPIETVRECPKWLRFLDDTFDGDKSRIAHLQELFGYCLTPDVHREKFWIFLGESRTGKSTVLHVLEHLIGKVNTSHLPLDLFAERFQLDMTRNKLLNIFAETEDLRNKVIAVLKMFTSGETISTDRKGQPGYDLTPTARLVCASNNLPAITDGALWERLTVIPFDHVVAEDDRNTTLKAELVSEELGGIFHWALQGLTRLTRQNRFTTSPAIEAAKTREQTDADPVSVFLRERYQPGPSSGFIYTQAVQTAFEKWCNAKGIEQPASHEILLGRAMRKVFPGVQKKQPSNLGRQCQYWGLQLRPESPKAQQQ